MTKGITIDEAKKQLHDKVLRAMQESMMGLEADIKLVTPVLTGTLRRSITNKVEDKGSKIIGEVGSYGVEYAAITDMRVPYLENTVDANLEKIRQKIRDVVNSD